MARISYLDNDGYSYEGNLSDADRKYLSGNLNDVPQDCWITGFGFFGRSSENVVDYRLVLYRDNTLVFQTLSRGMGTAAGWREASCNVRAGRGATMAWLFQRSTPLSDVTSTMLAYDTVATGASRNWRVPGGGTSPPPTMNPLRPHDRRFGDMSYYGYLDYVPNEAPSQGAWRAVSPSGLISNRTPTFSGTTPHSGADSAYDDTAEVHLQVYRFSDGVMAYDNLFPVTAAEQNDRAFSRSPVTLAPNTTYRARFRHRDTWGVYSEWSSLLGFTTAEIPDPPEPRTPSGKLNVAGNYDYDFLYTHPNGLEANAKQIQVWNSTGTTLLFESAILTLSPTVAVNTIISTLEFHANLSWGTSYKWRARVKDTSENWSVYSRFTDFFTNAAPNPPTGLVPANNKTTRQTAFSFSVSDPEGDTITAAQGEIVRVANNAPVRNRPQWAARASRVLGDERTPVTLNGSRYKVVVAGTTGTAQPTFPTAAASRVRDNAGMVAVARSTAYAVGSSRLRPAGALATDADWWECTTAGTSAATAPVYPNPGTAGQTITDGTSVWTCRKTVTWEQAGSDTLFDATVSADGTSASFSADTLVFGTDYKWRAQATDGFPSGYGTFSGYEFFRYADVPVVALLSPAIRSNLTRQPSAEYDPATLSPYWTETARTATDSINIVRDGGAAFGFGSWEGASSATGDNRYLTPLEPIDATKPYLATAWFKRTGGAPAAHFALVCCNDAGAVLGTVYPSSVGLANGASVPSTWSRYGGVVWPAGSSNAPAFPAGTTRVRREITPSRLSAAVVRFDAVALEQLPVLNLTNSSGAAVSQLVAWGQVANWHGYADGDTEGHGPEEASGYSWDGAAGDSFQKLPSILTGTQTGLAIFYSSATGSAKKDDRVLIERWQGRFWSNVHDTGFPPNGEGSARTLVPLPSGKLKNEGRYRIKVFARDAAEAVGESDWVEVDVRYDGPPELNIQTRSVDPVKAVLSISFEASSLSALEFGGVEVAREATDGSEPLEVFALITDPASNSASYHFPVSGREYVLKVRQVQNVGAEQVEGRWSNAILSVDYSPYDFVKDVEDPGNLYVAYETAASRRTPLEEDAPSSIHLPWGSTDEVHLIGRARPESGEVAAEFYVEASNVESAETRYRKMERMKHRRRTICVMRQIPDPGKTFASVIGPAKTGFVPTRTRTVEFSWRKNGYSEDYYAREGS